MADELQGLHGHGASLSGSVSGEIADILSINIAGMDVTDMDVTTMSSTNKWMEFKAGLKNAGELTLEILYSSDMMATLLSKLGGDNETWTLSFSDNGQLVVEGYLRSKSTAVPHDDRITQSVGIKISGEPTWVPASSGV